MYYDSGITIITIGGLAQRRAAQPGLSLAQDSRGAHRLDQRARLDRYVCVYIYIYIYVLHVCIYIYIYRERDVVFMYVL